MNLQMSIAILLLLVGCVRHDAHKGLSYVEKMSLSFPAEALDSLNKIRSEALSEPDRHLYNFLLVKLSDKTYKTHTSDSLILNVLDYESSHRNNGRYAEALYYGGRVYSDLGDYPTALRFYQKSLDELSSSGENVDLMANVLSQYARLLNVLRLYDKATQLLEKAIEIDRQRKDTINLIYDLHLLGNIYVKCGNYEFAESLIRESMSLSEGRDGSLVAKSKMNMAMLKYKSLQPDSALFYIRGVPDKVRPISSNAALGYASSIYMEANILDTAFMYAKEILRGDDDGAMETAYQVLLSDRLIHRLPIDSIVEYVKDYRDLIEKYQDRNEQELTINQETFHNYQLHVREKEKIAKDKNILLIGVLLLFIIILILIVIVLQYKNRMNSNLVKLQQALENIEDLKKDLIKVSAPVESSELAEPDIAEKSEALEEKRDREIGLRNKLQNELMSIYNTATRIPEVPESILRSDAYSKLQDVINQNKMLKVNESLWDDLEQLVLTVSPEFRQRLNLLTLGNIKIDDLHFALLVKCGIKPIHMEIILGKSNGALISRRTSLCVKVLDEKYKADVINHIIRLL